MTIPWDDLPEEATFAEAAALADKYGVFTGATADKLRHMARSRRKTTWPFGDKGEGRAHEYGKVANARKMNLRVLFKHLEDEPPNPHGRGPDKQPRVRRRAAQ